MLKRLLPLFLFVILVIFLYVGLGRNPRELPSPLIDKPAPGFVLQDLFNPDLFIDASVDFKGKVALVNVWASWCVTCRREHPALMRLSKEGKTPIYGINYKDTRQEAKHYLAALGNPFAKVVFDPAGTAGLDWGVYATPETFIIDKEGIIRLKHVGNLTDEVLNSKVLPKLVELQNKS